MSLVAVTKMHGTQNDFVISDQRKAHTIEDPAAFARQICDRRTGIGADGLLVLEPSTVADARMRIFNADGTEAEMCGNGLRCAVRYLCELGEGKQFRIETIAGVLPADVLETGAAYMVRARVGIPVFETRSLPFPNAAYVVVGNPHVVIFERDLDSRDLTATARQLQPSPAFPDGINVHVAVCVDEHRIDARHYERGAGLTYACGTGAVACAAAAMRLGMAKTPVEVHVPGGVLEIEWDGEHEAFLTGPAVRVFDASVESLDATPA